MSTHFAFHARSQSLWNGVFMVLRMVLLMAAWVADNNAYAQRFDGYTLRVKLLGDGLQSEALYRSVIPAWERATGARVEVLAIMRHADLDRALKQDMAERTLNYCVASNHTSFNPQYLGLFRDLATLIPADYLKNFDPHVLALARTGNALLQLPRYTDISQIFYNKDVYESAATQAAYQARFHRPLQAPGSWTEFAQQAHFLSHPPTLYGTQFAGTGEPLTGRFYEMLVAQGGQLFDKNWRPAFNSPSGVRALQFFVDLYQDGSVSPDTPTQGWQALGDAFAAGKVAVSLDWGSWAGHFNQPLTSKIAGRVGVARAPAGPGGRRTGWAGTHSFSITRACDNPEAAASFLMALTSLEAQALEARNGALVPRKDALTLVRGEFKKQGNQFMETVLDIFASAMTADAFTPPLVPEWSAISDAMWPSLQGAIVGKVSVQAALRTAEERVIGVMQDAGRMR